MNGYVSPRIGWITCLVWVFGALIAIASIKAVEPPVSLDPQPIVGVSPAGQLVPDFQARPARPVEAEIPTLSPPPASLIETNESDRHGREALSPRQKEASAVIAEELPGASEEEKEIWLNELGSLPASVIRDILQHRNEHDELRLRERFSLDRMLSGRTRDPLEPSLTPQIAERANQARLSLLGNTANLPASEALLLARAATCENIANALSLGYKRIEIELVSASSENDGTRQVSSQLEPLVGKGHEEPFSMRMSVRFKRDLSSGPIEPASDGSAFAITGSGWLRCRKHSNQERLARTYLLRTGTWRLSADGGLIVDHGNHTFFVVDEWGVTDRVGSLRQIERLELVGPPQLAGAGLAIGELGSASTFALSEDQATSTSPASPPPSPATPQNGGVAPEALGKIVLGKTEGSNVDLELELARLKKLNAMLTALGSN